MFSWEGPLSLIFVVLYGYCWLIFGLWPRGCELEVFCVGYYTIFYVYAYCEDPRFLDEGRTKLLEACPCAPEAGAPPKMLSLEVYANFYFVEDDRALSFRRSNV